MIAPNSKQYTVCHIFPAFLVLILLKWLWDPYFRRRQAAWSHGGETQAQLHGAAGLLQQWLRTEHISQHIEKTLSRRVVTLLIVWLISNQNKAAPFLAVLSLFFFLPLILSLLFQVRTEDPPTLLKTLSRVCWVSLFCLRSTQVLHDGCRSTFLPDLKKKKKKCLQCPFVCCRH